MNPTKLEYSADTYQFLSTATVVDVGPGDGSIVLDRTIFYPQGGGQPTDKGFLRTPDARFRVDKVELVNGVVYHRGTFEQGRIQVGDAVELAVHEATRRQNAKLHTGGHLIMTALDSLKRMKAVKGYHFPDGPYVEFLGMVPEAERASLVDGVQRFINQAIEQGSDVNASETTLAALEAEGVFIPMEIPRDKPTRVITTCGYKSPCGGTHVATLKELAGLKVRSLKVKGGNTRVSYTIG